jgi:hypothetical protein
MTPQNPVPSVAKVTVSGTLGLQRWANVFHVKYNADFLSGADALVLATGFFNKYGTRFAPFIGANWTLLQAICQDLDNTSGVSAVFNGSTPPSGSGNACPNNVALCIGWRVAERWRGGHGRSYMAGPPIGKVQNGNLWDSTYAGQVEAAANGFIADINALTGLTAAPATLGIVRRVAGGITLATPTFHPTLSARVDLRIDSMRSRLGRDLP